MSFVIYDHSYIKKHDFSKLCEVIYYNFKELEQKSELKHNKREIKKTINDKNSFVVLYIDEKMKKILGYVTCSEMILSDGRKVIYISYIYVSKKLRESGVGSKLIDICKNICSEKNCDGILLTCDTENEKLVEFYQKRGFMLDFMLRQYTRHDVFFMQNI